MAKIKLTKWYKGYQKPVRIGVYERDYFNDFVMPYCYWNGRTFGHGSDTIEGAERNGIAYKDRSYLQNIPWRGVAK